MHACTCPPFVLMHTSGSYSPQGYYDTINRGNWIIRVEREGRGERGEGRGERGEGRVEGRGERREGRGGRGERGEGRGERGEGRGERGREEYRG